MNYCSQCGRELVVKTPPGDHLPRHLCEHCGTIHYLNPKLVVGCLCEWNGKVLLCRRAIDPRAGFWTLPAGFMENGETTEQGAARETREEALAEAEDLSPLSLINVPHVNQVHLIFRARLRDGRFGAGTETLEAGLYAERDIPWTEIAFPSVRFALEQYFSDRQRGQFGFHLSTWQQPAAT